MLPVQVHVKKGDNVQQIVQGVQQVPDALIGLFSLESRFERLGQFLWACEHVRHAFIITTYKTDDF